MSIALVVKKGSQACIAADTLSSWGSLLQSERYSENPSKIHRFKESYIANVGAGAHDVVLRHFFMHHTDKVDLSGVDAIFSTWLALHSHLTQDYHLNPGTDSDYAYETSRLTALVANSTGIYVVASMRSVDGIKRFWAIGSGQEYALGAMHAVYDDCHDVREIANAGLNAAIEFDDACGNPVDMFTVELESQREGSPIRRVEVSTVP